MAESLSIVPEKIFEKIKFISVSSVFGKSLCFNMSLSILIMSVLCFLSIVGLISPTSNKNLGNYIDWGLFPFLITRMFIDKLSFIAEFHMSGHFINDALTTTDLDAFEMASNICRGSPQNITILPSKKLL